MTSSLACIVLILYMEGRSLPDNGQKLIAQVVINRATKDGKSICDEMSKPSSYTFYHKKKVYMVDDIDALVKATVLGKEVLEKNTNPKYKPLGYLYFNECRLKKRFITEMKVRKIANMCYY